MIVPIGAKRKKTTFAAAFGSILIILVMRMPPCFFILNKADT